MTPARSLTPESSWKELTFEAATKAYEDAGVNVREDVESFITCAEDYWEGFGIFDEFVPDQLGAVMRPTCTITGDGLQGLAAGAMQIESGLFDIVAVEAHSKASDILSYNDIVLHSFDPIHEKPLGGHPYYVAGMEMEAFLRETGTSREPCAAIVEKNRINALANPWAAYGANVTAEDVLASEEWFTPLRRLEIARLADSAVVLVLASEKVAPDLTEKPIWIRGLGWASDSPSLTNREWGRAKYAELAARKAFEQAGLGRADIDFAEVDDQFAYKEFQHLEAIGLAPKGEAPKMLEEGQFEVEGELPVNPSGGSLGVGNLLEANGLFKAAQVTLQLRGEAGKNQVKGDVGLAQSWRGIPTNSGAVAILGVSR